MCTRDDIKSIMEYVMLAYPNFKPNLDGKPNIVDVWFDQLGDFSTDDVKIATKAYCSEDHDFAPNPGQLRGAIAKLRTADLPLAGEAWDEVIQYIKTNGCHGETPEFSHPAVKRAAQIIGMEVIGMSEDIMMERAHFLKVYEQLRNREVVDVVQLPALTDYVEKKRFDDKMKTLTDKLEVVK